MLRRAVDKPIVDDLRRLVTSGFAAETEKWRRATGLAYDDSSAIDQHYGPRSEPFAALTDDLKHLARGELPLPVRLNPMLKRICDAAALIRVLRRHFGNSGLRLHNPPSIRVSMPGRAISNVPPHQDWSYNRHISDFVTVWVPLVSIDDRCGGTDVFAGSHCLGRLAHRPGNNIWSQSVAASPENMNCPKRHYDMEPGDVLLFDPLLLHASRPNTSRRVRFSIDYRFFDAATPTTKHCYDIERRRIIPPEHREPEPCA